MLGSETGGRDGASTWGKSGSGKTASSIENAKSSLSQSGEIKWKKEQYIVVSQDEQSGESSPLDVFITNSESDALEKVHFNMTNERPIYFLYPNTLASDYNEKY